VTASAVFINSMIYLMEIILFYYIAVLNLSYRIWGRASKFKSPVKKKNSDQFSASRML
jgi:hypothetical protein